MFDPSTITLPKTRAAGNPHPLVLGLKMLADLDIPAIALARALNVTPQMLYIWRRKAIADRDFLLPAEQVPVISKITGIEPHMFRPDLWKKGWVF